MVTDEEWQAVVENDKTYDDVFRYVVKTTRIFCRPSCPSRIPKRENIDIYYDLEEPEKRGYRPCKRCQPTGEVVGEEEWVKEIEIILENNYQHNLSLEELSHLARGSESHLRHVFKKITNQTPQQRLMSIRMEKAKEKILETELSISEIAIEVGLPNVSYFIRKFGEYYGESPKQYRKNNKSTKQEEKELLKQFQLSWAKNKYWVMSRSQQAYNQIRLLAKGNQWTSEKQKQYEIIVERLESVNPTEQTLRVTYQHIWGYFKKQASVEEKEMYQELIKQNKLDDGQLEILLIKLTKKYNQSYLLKMRWLLSKEINV